jgi:hypothetical protein
MSALLNQVRAGLRYLRTNLADGALQARIQDTLDGLPEHPGTESICRIIPVLERLRESMSRQIAIKVIDPLIRSLQSSLPAVEERCEYGRVQMSLVMSDGSAVRFELHRLAALCVEGACVMQEWETSQCHHEQLVLTHRQVLREFRRKDASYDLDTKYVKGKRSWMMVVQDLQYVAASANGFLQYTGQKEHDKSSRRRKGRPPPNS